MTTRYSIKDLEKLSGIKAHTIRAWESRYKLIQPKRTSTNIRYYGDEDLVKILNTAILVEAGRKISDVAKLDEQQLKDQALAESPYLGNYNYEMNELKIATTTFDIDRFERVLSYCISTYGTHTTYQSIIGDFVLELGKLWLNGIVSISQEHFMSSLIRQKLFATIDSVPTTKDPNAQSLALFLPANELHEIGILYLAYLLKERGYKVYYLGQSLPKEYLSDLTAIKQLDHIISVFTTYPDESEIVDYLNEMSELLCTNCEFHITGFQCNHVPKDEIPPNFYVYDNLKSLATRFE